MAAGRLMVALILAFVLTPGCRFYENATGTEGGACYGNGTCDEGLTCANDACVNLPDASISLDAEPVDAHPADARPLSCNDDSAIEPNDTVSTAWVTPIPGLMSGVSLVQLAICPTTDIDLFRFSVEAAGKNMKATITVDENYGPLLLQVLNAAGATIASGEALNTSTIEVAINNLAVGIYLVKVFADVGNENNYSIDIVTCDGSPVLLV